MKIDVLYEKVLDAIEKLQTDKPLDKQEKDEVLKVLLAVQGDYLPSRLELDMQISNIKAMDKVDYEKNPDLWERLNRETTEFENKYC